MHGGYICSYIETFDNSRHDFDSKLLVRRHSDGWFVMNTTFQFFEDRGSDITTAEDCGVRLELILFAKIVGNRHGMSQGNLPWLTTCLFSPRRGQKYQKILEIAYFE